MGLSIGQISGSLAGSRFSSNPERVQGPVSRTEAPRTLGSPRPEGQDFALFRENSPPARRVGFGEGTISGPAAALETIERGVRNTREIVPTIQELRAEQRARTADARRATQQEPPQPRERRNFRIESRLPEPSALARNFINELNDTAAANQARFSGEDPFENQGGATVEINGEQIAFGVRVNAGQDRIFDGSRIAPRIDVSI